MEHTASNWLRFASDRNGGRQRRALQAYCRQLADGQPVDEDLLL